MAKNKQIEFRYQCQIFQWADRNQDKYPELAFLEGSMNGVRLLPGVIQKAKAAGCLKKGRPDIHLPVKRGNFGALFIELKTEEEGSKPDPDQEIYLTGLQALGNYVAVCIGVEATKKAIIGYLEEILEGMNGSDQGPLGWWNNI